MDLTKLKSLEGITIDDKQKIDVEGTWPRIYLTEPILISTRQLAEIFCCTPQRINQYVADDGLPKIGRDQFDLATATNWHRAKIIADACNMKLKNMYEFGVVDFGLVRTGISIDESINKIIWEVINCIPKMKESGKQKFYNTVFKKLFQK